MRSCRVCSVHKPLEDFPKHRTSARGRNSRCKQCERAYQAEYRARNKDRLAAAKREYSAANREALAAKARAHYRANREAVLARNAAWAAANRDDKLAYQRSYREQNREAILAGQRDWYARNADKSKQAAREWRLANRDKFDEAKRAWIASNRDAVRAIKSRYKHRRRAAQSAAGVYEVTATDLRRLLDRAGGKCSYCRTPFTAEVAVTWDHVVPVSRGGAFSVGNLVPACGSCNSSKGSRTVTEWRAWRILIGQHDPLGTSDAIFL